MIGNLDCTIIAQKPKLSPHKVCRDHGSCSWSKQHAAITAGASLTCMQTFSRVGGLKGVRGIVNTSNCIVAITQAIMS